MSSSRRVWAEIDLAALRENLALARSRIPGETQILGVVKADAYGHGAVPISRALSDAGIAMLGVGDAHEAIELRDAGLNDPILVLGATLEGEIPDLIANRIIPTIHSPERIRTFADAASREEVILPVHLLVDTGMSRLGVTPECALDHLRAIAAQPALRLAGIGTHLASPDQAAFSREQLARFQGVIDQARVAGLRPPIVHVASSIPLDRYPETSHDMVRLGGYLYGLRPNTPGTKETPRPVLSLRTEVAYLRDHPAGTAIGYGCTFVTDRPTTRLATLPIGYHDGFPHALSNRGSVLIRGQRAPVRGRVTMDYVMVDVSEIDGVETGDPVTIIGKDAGTGDGAPDQILASEVAEWAGTIPYEIPCRLGPRVERVVLDADRKPKRMTAGDARRSGWSTVDPQRSPDRSSDSPSRSPSERTRRG